VAERADDYYALLGLDAAADLTQLRKVWRKLAVKWHPDRAGPAATATFQKISAAYAVLSDPVARAAYDRKRAPVASRPRAEAPGVMLHAYSGALNGLLLRGLARHAERGVIELLLDGETARTGGMITVSMPVSVRCTECHSRGGACAKCEGRGHTEELYSAWLAVPPGVTDATMLAPSAKLAGMLWPVSFRVRVDAV
jgi:molecular chaperone DnaJ